MHSFCTIADGPVQIKQINEHLVDIVMNKPKALNALDLDMIRTMYKYIKSIDNSNTIKTVWLEGAGEKAFCAGGDIKSLYEAKISQDPAKLPILENFFREEYMLDYALTQMNPVQIAVMDGIVMGGGVGVSVHAPIRIATEYSVFAMPEAKIGLFTDVGGGYFLSRMRKNLGLYVGLTGARLKGQELVQTGIADYYIPREKLQSLREKLISTLTNESNLQSISKVVQEYSEKVQQDYKNEDQINELFQSESFEEFYKKMENDTSDFGKKTFNILQGQNAISLRVIYEQIKRAEKQKLDLKDALKIDFRLTQRFMAGNDFHEGVRTVLIDRNDTPKWTYKSPLDVPQQEIDSYFAPLTNCSELDI
ncbi:hypothetical protein PPERSA_04889 [Pseudocohnilembus persalinus]|uniref:3-hydroxyisobutyryl-CoA hydrolase n=1 Tax=Pseudocohnilembus persalinus TaxID=266149 RepID=A0A0V0QJC7_PSEPJ|nr:hypothetical protein PPERSA_04889 [Pseudocohnilembus persalinus]|eukprot:KRX02267.1 hypothetical protein PPERSA_04889 [Pseudocohnilembus persalinus]